MEANPIENITVNSALHANMLAWNHGIWVAYQFAAFTCHWYQIKSFNRSSRARYRWRFEMGILNCHIIIVRIAQFGCWSQFYSGFVFDSFLRRFTKLLWLIRMWFGATRAAVSVHILEHQNKCRPFTYGPYSVLLFSLVLDSLVLEISSSQIRFICIYNICNPLF